ncbi:MAG: histidine kinase, partial [Acidimicrobiales bacterium]
SDTGQGPGRTGHRLGVFMTTSDGPAGHPDRWRIAVGRVVAAIAVATSIGVIASLVAQGQWAQLYDEWVLHNALPGLVFGVFGWFMVGAQPRNRAVWALVGAGMFGGVSVVDAAVPAPWLAGSESFADGLTIAGNSLWIPSVGLMTTVGLLWFPSGRVSGWRHLLGLYCLVTIAAFTVAMAVESSRQIGPDPGYEPGTTWNVLGVAFGVAIALSLVDLVLRYRDSSGVEQRQFRWIMWGSGLLAVTIIAANVADLVLSGAAGGPVFQASAMMVVPVTLASFAIAVWRHQLFDVDIVISRTLIYGSVLAVITSVYVIVVFGFGQLIGADRDSPLLPVMATVLIALVVQPARARLEHVANRLVFGRQATPYEVLSDFTRRLAATDDHLLATVAKSVAEGTVATGATVWSLQDDTLHPVSSWPGASVRTPAVARYRDQDGALVAPGADQSFPITMADRSDGMIIGVLGVNLPWGESLPPADLALISELTSGIGLALWNRRLTEELEASVDDLRASRRRLVAVQDETRHRLERDLHDGAQQRLVAVKVRLSISRQMAAKGGAVATEALLARLCGEADEAVESLRDFARGVYPPLLEAEGLEAALRSRFDRLRQTVELRVGDIGRHPRDVEATVYFCVVDLLTQPGVAEARCSVSLTVEAGALIAEVETDRPVVVPLPLDDRVQALAGTLTRVERSSGPTLVRFQLPAAPHHVAAAPELVPL